jgi:phosphopantothenate synthetase
MRRRNAEKHAIELEKLDRIARQDEVSVVDRIKRAAVKSKSHG